MMRKTLLLLAILAIPVANAQTIPESETSEFEDFESYSLGAFSGDKGFYIATAAGHTNEPCDPATYCTIVSGGLDGTGQALLKTRPSSGEIQINLNVKDEFVTEAQTAEFVVSFHAQLTTSSTATTMFIGSDFTDANIQATFLTTGDLLMRGATTACGTTRGTSAPVSGVDSGDDNKYTLVFRTNGTVDIFVNDVFKQTEFDYGCGDVDVIAYQQGGTTGSSLGLLFDQWIWGGIVAAVEEEEPGGPSEFDSGLIAFAASAGFISQESQLFFALVLIGLATVTTSASSKWVAPGRFKNYLIMGVQALVAVFCVIAAFLDLWMFLVAFMLGLFAVRGGSEIRNSFQEIKAAVNRQNERQGADMGPTEVMEVQVSEERQEAVERALQRIEDGPEASDSPDSPEMQAEATETAQEREE